MRQRFVILAAILLAASSAGAQSALHFSLPFGPYAVGFRAVDQYDYTRSFGDPYDENGHPRTGERARPIPTSIWYPSVVAVGDSRMRYREYVELWTSPGSFPTRDTGGTRLDPRKAPDSARIRRELAAPTHAVRDARDAPGSFPVIVYGPSVGAQSVENALLMEYLASYGYIVVASPSVGAQGMQTTDLIGLETEARDMEFLIGYARTIPGADVSRLAVMGCSWGGGANVLVAMRNPAVTALASLDGVIAYNYHSLLEKAPFVDLARFTVPALFLKQRPLVRPGPDSAFDFFKDIRYADAYVVNLQTLLHQNFMEWADRLNHGPTPFFDADTLVQTAGYERIALYTRNFLDAYLKQSADAKAFLARSPTDNGFPSDEVTIQRKTALLAPILGAFMNALTLRHRSPADASRMLADVRGADPTYVLDEDDVNDWGNRLIDAKQFVDAIGVFSMNVAMYPKSADAYDSLGEAYALHGDRALAIENYQRALDLDPKSTSAAAALKRLKGGGGSYPR